MGCITYLKPFTSEDDIWFYNLKYDTKRLLGVKGIYSVDDIVNCYHNCSRDDQEFKNFLGTFLNPTENLRLRKFCREL